jgi:hypothetical protein
MVLFSQDYLPMTMRNLLLFILVQVVFFNIYCIQSVDLPSNHVPAHYKAKELFYIYDDDEWVKIATASLYKRDPNERLENQYNHGSGPLINTSSGAYHTDQYQLFSMIYYRALTDPRRTLDPTKATSFFIPYDFASDSAYYKNCARSHGVCFDFRKCPLAVNVEKQLLKSPYFLKNHGKDHTLIVGMNYAMDHYILKPKCKSLLAGTCANCTKFAIDDYSYMYSGDNGIKNRGDYWHAIPFPADFHWSSEVKRPFPWENDYRPILASYTGSEKSFYNPSRRLRQSIAHYCALHSDKCVHKSYGLNGTRYSFKVEGHNPLAVAQHSVFCFQPTGDLMTRKGLFDAILQGCIPVLFDALTARVMYTWHWEESFWNQASIHLDFHPISFRYQDPIVTLENLMLHNRSYIEDKQRLIRHHVFELQYSLHGLVEKYQFASKLPYLNVSFNNSHLLNLMKEANGTHLSENQKHAKDEVIYLPRNPSPSLHSSVVDTKEEIVLHYNETTWPKDKDGNYVRDAYEITMDYILGWHSGRWQDIRNATVPECWDGWLDTVMNKCRPGKGP